MAARDIYDRLLIDELKIRREAERVLSDTHLEEALRSIGTLDLDGALRYKLMVAADIDLNIVVPQLAPSAGLPADPNNEIVQLLAVIIRALNPVKLFYNDYRGTHGSRSERPTGVWVGANFNHGTRLWNIDIWVTDRPVHEYTQKVNLSKPMRERLNSLTDFQRADILAQKVAALRSDSPRISAEIYKAYLSTN